MIYSNDHPPPHVHVVAPDGFAKIVLGDENEGSFVLTNDGLSRAQLAAALIEVDRNNELLRRRWREIHEDS